MRNPRLSRVRWRIAVCAAASAVVPLVIYGQLVASLGAMPPQVRDGLRAWTIRLALSVAAVAFILSVATCAWVASRRARKPSVFVAVVGDIGLALGFLLAPWISLKLSGATVDEVISLWVGPGALMRALPSICAAVAGLAFAALTRLARKPEPAV